MTAKQGLAVGQFLTELKLQSLYVNKVFEFEFRVHPGILVSANTNPEEKRSAMKLVRAQCCFTSIETVQTISDGEPRTATSTFTQLLSSD